MPKNHGPNCRCDSSKCATSSVATDADESIRTKPPLFVNRKGEVVPLSIFGNAKPHNSSVLALSGAGMSYGGTSQEAFFSGVGGNKAVKIMFGCARSGKTRKMIELAAQSINHGRGCIYFGRDEDISELIEHVDLKRDITVCHSSCLGDLIKDQALSPRARAKVVLLGIDMFDRHLPSAADLLPLMMSVVGASGCSESCDVYIDDGVKCLTSPIHLIGNVTVTFQSVAQLDEIVGKEVANQFIGGFKKVEFFRCHDRRSLEKATELSGGDVDESAISMLSRGQSVKIHQRGTLDRSE